MTPEPLDIIYRIVYNDGRARDQIEEAKMHKRMIITSALREAKTWDIDDKGFQKMTTQELYEWLADGKDTFEIPFATLTLEWLEEEAVLVA